jgi:hypothetical protein
MHTSFTGCAYGVVETVDNDKGADMGGWCVYSHCAMNNEGFEKSRWNVEGGDGAKMFEGENAGWVFVVISRSNLSSRCNE